MGWVVFLVCCVNWLVCFWRWFLVLVCFLLLGWFVLFWVFVWCWWSWLCWFFVNGCYGWIWVCRYSCVWLWCGRDVGCLGGKIWYFVFCVVVGECGCLGRCGKIVCRGCGWVCIRCLGWCCSCCCVCCIGYVIRVFVGNLSWSWCVWVWWLLVLLLGCC